MYKAFGVHKKGQGQSKINISDAIDLLQEVNNELSEFTQQVKTKLDIDRQPNVPEGCLSSLTVRSIDMTLNSVKRLSTLITEFNPAYLPEVNLESCLTIMVENLHAISHIKQQFPTMLQHFWKDDARSK